MRNYLLAALLLLAPTVGWAQGNTNTVPPMCTAETLLTTCVPQVQGTVARITDATNATVCTNSGAGTTNVTCQFNGSAWGPMATIGATGGVWTGANGETMFNSPDSTFTFQNSGNVGVILKAADSSAPANLTLDATTTGTITVGSSDVASISLIADSSTLTFDGGNLTINQTAANGNGDDINKFVGVPKMSGFVLGSSIANGTTSTTNVDFGDSETPNTDWTQTTNVTTSNESTIFRKGTASLKMVFGASLADTNGANVDFNGGSGDQDWQGDGSFGMWARCTKITIAGTFDLQTVDATATNLTQIPAITVADQWQWLEVDLDEVADNALDVITAAGIHVDAPGATLMASETCYFDYMWQWDAGDEADLGLDVLEDGVIAIYSLVTATANDRTPVLEVAGTDYFIHYETGDDALVPVSDLSNDSLWGMAALE